MLIYNIKLIIKHIFLTLFFVIASGYLFPNNNYAQTKNLIEGFDYSNLSPQQSKQEVELLYKYAKRAYDDNDFETAQKLFYQILELDSNSKGATIYLGKKIPDKISEIKNKEKKT